MNATDRLLAPPQLAPPGAGLPPLEAWLVRLFARPLLRRRYSRETALAAIEETSRRLLDKTASLSPEQLSTPQLIARLRGLEDSSRFWSPSMVLEHLGITGRATIQTVLLLTHGKRPTRIVSTAAVKPAGREPREVREEFAALHQNLREELATAAGSEWNALTHDHPWFGPLNATDWLRMMAMHLQLHEKQLDLVLQAGIPR